MEGMSVSHRGWTSPGEVIFKDAETLSASRLHHDVLNSLEPSKGEDVKRSEIYIFTEEEYIE